MPARKELSRPVIKTGITWYIEYYIEPQPGKRKRVRRSTLMDGTPLNSIKDIKERERQAELLVKDILLRISPVGELNEKTLFIDALDEAVLLKRSNKWTTNKSFQDNARWLKQFFEEKGWRSLRCHEVQLKHIQAYFDYNISKLNVANSTYNTRKNHVRALLTELVQRDYLKENYASSVRYRPPADTKRRPFTVHERDIVFKEMAKTDRAMFLVGILVGYLAIRPGEIRNLRVKNIDLKRGVVDFPGSQSKNNRRSTVTIPAQVLPIIKTYELNKYPGEYYLFGCGKPLRNSDFLPNEKPVGVNTLQGRFKRILEQLHSKGKLKDITGLSLYSLKDTLAIYLLDSGIDVETCMRHFRHSSLEMFQRYVKRLGVVQEKIRELPVDLPQLPE